jgi:hypothetical protein
VVIGTEGVELSSTQFDLQAALPQTATTSAKPPLVDGEVQDGDWTPLKWDADGGGAGVRGFGYIIFTVYLPCTCLKHFFFAI